MRDKIQSIEQLAGIVAEAKGRGQVVVHCHGVFDLLHIGHIKHLESARKLGDLLVVTITPDRFVNKGPHRPAFPEKLRAEALASLLCVDYVSINQWPSAVETIELLRPNLYVKGAVPEKGKRDHTGVIIDEERAIDSVGGRMVLTEEVTYSASALINRHLNVFTPEAQAFLESFRDRYTEQEVLDCVRRLEDLRVLVVGEAIIDQYEFCTVMGKANKEPVLAARHLRGEKYAGGSLAVANHVANFCGSVGLVSMLGEYNSGEAFIRSKLNKKIDAHFVVKHGSPTIVKQRFLQEYKSVKLFELYTMNNERLSQEDEEAVCAELAARLPHYDVVIAVDYGHGMLRGRAVDLLCDRSRFLCVNAQVNAGNHGFNMISKYSNASFVSMAEPELRLETRDLVGDIRELVSATSQRVSCERLLLTRGEHGCLYYSGNNTFTEVPALAIRTVDRIGAGDAVLAVTGPCAAQDVPAEILCFVGNVVGAEACLIMGNERSIEATNLFRHISSLMK